MDDLILNEDAHVVDLMVRDKTTSSKKDVHASIVNIAIQLEHLSPIQVEFKEVIPINESNDQKAEETQQAIDVAAKPNKIPPISFVAPSQIVAS